MMPKTVSLFICKDNKYNSSIVYMLAKMCCSTECQ